MDKAKKGLMSYLGKSPSPTNASSETTSWDCSPGTSLLLPNRCNQGTKESPVLGQKTFYGDVLTPGASGISGDVSAGPCMYHSLLRQADLEQHTPKVTTFKVPEDFGSVLDKQVIGPTTENLIKSDFPVQTFKPKVQIAFQGLPGQCPREVEIERRRRLYLTFDIAQLLASKGIDSNQLMPRHRDPDNMPTIQEKKDPVFGIYLPLKIFDDEEYDCRTPEEWISLGQEPGSQDRKPVPGKALLPTDDVLGHEDPKSQKLIYEWIDVGVLDYDKETKLYLVHKRVQNALVRDEEGRAILNRGITPEGRPPLLPCQYWVPRVLLLFLAEDPRVFAERVASASSLRKKTQALLLYHLYVDCMPTDGLHGISEESLEEMKLLAMHTPRLKEDKRMLDFMCSLEKEVQLDYERTMNSISFDRIVMSRPETLFYVTLPDKEEEKVPDKGLIQIPAYPFDEQRADFHFFSLLTKPEVIPLLTQVQDECNKAATMSLFNSALARHVCLEEFEQIQTQTFSQVQMFLKDTWINTLKTAVKSNLGDAHQGWYNLKQSHWDIYQMSKLCKLMKRIKFMLQDSVRYLVQNSLINFTQPLLDACHGILLCSKNMEWGDDLINSPYRPQRNPLFLTALVLDGSGVHFSPPVESFEKSLVSLFDKGILVTHTIPQLEKYVLENIPIPGTPLLDSVGLQEPAVEELREALRCALQKALIPLQAYAKRYEKFLELNNNDVHSFLRDYEEQCPSAQEVMSIVNTYLTEKENLDSTLPSSIVIGPFHVSTEAVKQNLSEKYKALATSMLDILAKNLNLQVKNICDAYKAVSCRMHEKPNSVEELAELQEWMKEVPKQLAVQEELIGEVMEDYKVLEEFLYSLTDEDFSDKLAPDYAPAAESAHKHSCTASKVSSALKYLSCDMNLVQYLQLEWAASYWPLKITMEAKSIRLQHLEDEDKFRKVQVMVQNNFQQELEEMQLTVDRFSIQTDVNQAHELSNKAKDVRKQLKELQNLSVLYNNRERILGMKVTNCSSLSRMVKDFQPYYSLWTTVSDWMHWHEKWMNNSLVEIEVEQLEKNVSDSFKTMQRCVKQFKDLPACQSVAMEFRDKIEEFRLYIPLIQGLCNPGMRRRHWEMLSEDIHINIGLEPGLTLGCCLEMNLLDHIESITNVAEIAGKEYTIENALNEMESEWDSISFTVMLYKDTGTFILKNIDAASQLLEDHIGMIQSMTSSPFKKPFEERMSTWENKLKLTQDVLKEWLNCQHAWLSLEPIFRSEDVKRQFPLESEHYQAVDRDWRNIMKNANENPKVISLCPDPMLLEDLQKCNKLLELVQEGLGEYLETKRGAFPR